MDLQKGSKVSELLKEKIEYEKDLQELLDLNSVIQLKAFKNDRKLGINNDQQFIKKIRWLTILELNNKIEELDFKIKKLKYY